MRLIDADELRKDVLELPDCPNGYSDTFDKSLIIALVDEAPTVDAVPVVRCKDCRWYKTDYSWNGKEYRFCEFGHDIFRKADDFCSRAERKEE